MGGPARQFGRGTQAAAGILIFSVWETEYARTAIYFSFLELVYLGGLYLFYLAYFEERKRCRVWTLIVFLLAPHASQLAMGIWFAFPALLLVRGAKRFFRKDVLWPLGLTNLSYALVQVHEIFFWKVGFVYEKVPSSLSDVVRYFFTGFSLDYFGEVLRAFPRLGWVVFIGVFLFLGEAARRNRADDAEAGFRRGWYFLYLSLLFPLVFFGFFRTHVHPRYLFQLRPLLIVLFLIALWRAARGWRPSPRVEDRTHRVPAPSFRARNGFLNSIPLGARISTGSWRSMRAVAFTRSSCDILARRLTSSTFRPRPLAMRSTMTSSCSSRPRATT